MSGPLRLLHIEDSLSDAALTERALTRAGYQVLSERVENIQGMKAALAKQPWDVIIADYRLPDFDAPAALSLLQESGLDIPFIMVSGAIGEELAVAIMRAGAQDYLLKDDMARLAPAVEREIRDAGARRKRSQAELALSESRERFIEQAIALERQTVLLQQRETMLREIHHRVKNNMQVMSSLLSLQSRAASNEEIRRMLEDDQNRIQSMALLHEILYQSQDLALVDFSKYLLRMVDHLFRSYGVNSRQIRLHSDLDPIAIDLDDALPTGLLISEVISNSLKHGFPEGRSGEIRILLRRQSAGTVSLVLSDSGVGLPAGLDWTTSRSLGLRLVRALADQLRASLDIRSQGGTEVKMVFTPRRKDDTAEVALSAGGAR
ncbi:MAG TPA: histidine kinase dimerization/phosphoacceptor domain -containing protein [Bryobacteraceae bacterium]|nr:histidine kinase dimerization/phosphoacceptor domain -containing protein [Bryobacteraceae bacterium]